MRGTIYEAFRIVNENLRTSMDDGERNWLARENGILARMRKDWTGRSEKAGERRVGLARALSKLGYCSRAKAAELIRLGRVKLNGALTRNPEAPVRMGKDRIEVEGKRLGKEKRLYWMMNKPGGVVTTAEDEQGRETVYEVLAKAVKRSRAELPWMGPVGRLDRASEGLLLFTNDSEWAAKITAPETHLEKTYHVQIRGKADDSLLRALEQGIRTNSGEVLRAKRASLLRSGEKNSWIVVVLEEGKNRQIRRMLEALGVEVLRLVRVAIGPLELGTLAKGAARELTQNEKGMLDEALAAPR
jgi:23S rRNA pseudouridine2605 synthase